MGRVFVTDQAQKELLRLPRNEQIKIKKRLTTLEVDCFAGKKLVGKLSGFYSLKIWPYRVIYLLKGSNKQSLLLRNEEVWVVHILHRQGAFK